MLVSMAQVAQVAGVADFSINTIREEALWRVTQILCHRRHLRHPFSNMQGEPWT